MPVPVSVPVPARARRREPTVSGFDHDRLDVYRTAIEFVVLANEIAQQLH